MAASDKPSKVNREALRHLLACGEQFLESRAKLNKSLNEFQKSGNPWNKAKLKLTPEGLIHIPPNIPEETSRPLAESLDASYGAFLSSFGQLQASAWKAEGELSEVLGGSVAVRRFFSALDDFGESHVIQPASALRSQAEAGERTHGCLRIGGQILPPIREIQDTMLELRRFLSRKQSSLAATDAFENVQEGSSGRIRCAGKDFLFDGKPVKLRPQLKKALKVFLDSGGHACTRRKLENAIWPVAPPPGPNSLNRALSDLSRAIKTHLQLGPDSDPIELLDRREGGGSRWKLSVEK